MSNENIGTNSGGSERPSTDDIMQRILANGLSERPEEIRIEIEKFLKKSPDAIKIDELLRLINESEKTPLNNLATLEQIRAIQKDTGSLPGINGNNGNGNGGNPGAITTTFPPLPGRNGNGDEDPLATDEFDFSLNISPKDPTEEDEIISLEGMEAEDDTSGINSPVVNGENTTTHNTINGDTTYIYRAIRPEPNAGGEGLLRQSIEKENVAEGYGHQVIGSGFLESLSLRHGAGSADRSESDLLSDDEIAALNGILSILDTQDIRAGRSREVTKLVNDIQGIIDSGELSETNYQSLFDQCKAIPEISELTELLDQCYGVRVTRVLPALPGQPEISESSAPPEPAITIADISPENWKSLESMKTELTEMTGEKSNEAIELYDKICELQLGNLAEIKFSDISIEFEAIKNKLLEEDLLEMDNMIEDLEEINDEKRRSAAIDLKNRIEDTQIAETATPQERKDINTEYVAIRDTLSTSQVANLHEADENLNTLLHLNISATPSVPDMISRIESILIADTITSQAWMALISDLNSVYNHPTVVFNKLNQIKVAKTTLEELNKLEIIPQIASAISIKDGNVAEFKKALNEINNAVEIYKRIYTQLTSQGWRLRANGERFNANVDANVHYRLIISSPFKAVFDLCTNDPLILAPEINGIESSFIFRTRNDKREFTDSTYAHISSKLKFREEEFHIFSPNNELKAKFKTAKSDLISLLRRDYSNKDEKRTAVSLKFHTIIQYIEEARTTAEAKKRKDSKERVGKILEEALGLGCKEDHELIAECKKFMENSNEASLSSSESRISALSIKFLQEGTESGNQAISSFSNLVNQIYEGENQTPRFNKQRQKLQSIINTPTHGASSEQSNLIILKSLNEVFRNEQTDMFEYLAEQKVQTGSDMNKHFIKLCIPFSKHDCNLSDKFNDIFKEKLEVMKYATAFVDNLVDINYLSKYSNEELKKSLYNEYGVKVKANGKVPFFQGLKFRNDERFKQISSALKENEYVKAAARASEPINVPSKTTTITITHGSKEEKKRQSVSERIKNIVAKHGFNVNINGELAEGGFFARRRFNREIQRNPDLKSELYRLRRMARLEAEEEYAAAA